MSAPTDIFTTTLLPAMKSLRGFAMFLMRDPSDTDDVYQAAFERVWRYRDRFDTNLGSAEVWCMTILRHEAARFTNGERGWRSRLVNAADWAVDALSVGAIEPELDRMRRDAGQREWLSEQIEDLEPQFRMAIEDELAGVGCAESAAHQGCAIGTIHSRRFRARAAIARAAIARAA